MTSPNHLNNRLFLFSLLFAFLLLIPYELYWRNTGHFSPSHELENMDLWAEWRSQVDQCDSTDVVILGSSRGHFDLNIHLWESLTGARPIQLAYPGSSPFHPVADLVEKSSFNGLLVLSVAPGLFFTVKDSWGAGRGKAFVDHYHNRTYAQKFNHAVYKHIDPLLAYTDSDLSLKSLVNHLPFPNRDSIDDPLIWPPMVVMDQYRNVRMTDRFEVDTVLQKRQKDIWFPPEGKERKNRYKDSVDVILDHYVSHLKTFQARGGRVALIRPPVSGKYLATEPVLFPREAYWDRLVEECGVPGFHFQDHPDTRLMDPQEWSHLDKADSDTYTKVIISLLRKEGLIN